MKPIKSFPKRKIVTILSAILILPVALALSAYLIVHGYIGKLNIVTDTDTVLQAQQQDGSLQGLEVQAAEDEAAGAFAPAGQVVDAGQGTIQEEAGQAELPMNDAGKGDFLFHDATMSDITVDGTGSGDIPVPQDKDVFNVLLIGSDSRRKGGTGRSDAMILVSINKKSKEIIVTSLLRDIYLKIPGKQSNRLNAAYAYGSASLLLDTVEQNFRIQADRYASIDFYSFIDVIDAVGGVTLEVSKEDLPVINSYVREMNQLTGQPEEKDFLTEAGTLLLNGKQALGYSRNRYVGNSDFERTARQRRVLEQIFNRAKKMKLSELNKLLDTVLPMITTNLSEGEIFTVLLSLPSCLEYDIRQWSIPMKDTYSSRRIRGMEVLGIDLEKNIRELHYRVYGIEE